MTQYFADTAPWNMSLAARADMYGRAPKWVYVGDAINQETGGGTDQYYPNPETSDAPRQCVMDVIGFAVEDAAQPSTKIRRSAGTAKTSTAGSNRFTESAAFSPELTCNVSPNALVLASRMYDSNGHGAIVRANGTAVQLYAMHRPFPGQNWAGTSGTASAETILTYTSSASDYNGTTPINTTNVATGAIAAANAGGATDALKRYNDGCYGLRAAGFCALAGMIQRGELTQAIATGGVIPHVLALQIPRARLSAGRPFRWPAWNMDSSADKGYVDGVPDASYVLGVEYMGPNYAYTYGTHLALPPWIDIDSIRVAHTADANFLEPLTPAGKAIARTLQRYGCLVADASGLNGTGIFGFGIDAEAYSGEIGLGVDVGGYTSATRFTSSTPRSVVAPSVINAAYLQSDILTLISLLWAVDNFHELNGISTDPDWTAYFRTYHYYAPDLTALTWTSRGTPTLAAANQFTVTGDQTATFAVNTRVKVTNSAGTIVYGKVLARAYSSVTTVTLDNDTAQYPLSGTLSTVYTGA